MIAKGSRKRVKASPSGADSPSPASPNNAGRDRSDSQTQSRSSWYPGSWSAISRTSKAAPVTEVARESISVAQNVASSVVNSSTSLLDTPRQNRHPSIQLTKKAGGSTRSLPADVTTTRVNIASDGSASTTALDTLETSAAAEPTVDTDTLETTTLKPLEKSVEGQEPNVENVGTEPNNTQQETQAPAEPPSGWFSWIYKSGPAEKDKSTGAEFAGEAERSAENEPSKQAEPHPIAADTRGEQAQQEPEQQETAVQGGETIETTSKAQKRSWLQMWYGSGPSNNKQEEQVATEPTLSPRGDNTITPKDQDLNMAPQDPSERSGEVPPTSETPIPGTTKSSGWSFWSKDTSKDATSDKPQEVKAVEATVTADTPVQPTSLEPPAETNINITKKGSLKVKPSKDTRGSVSAVVEAPPAPTPPVEPKPVDAASKQLQRILPNQVLPKFEDTFAMEESPSLLQSLGRLLHYTKGPEHNHVARIKEPPRIKRALAIGVHGYFPAPLIRSVLGQPTGTSIRFSNMAAEAIRKYTADHGYTCDIGKIALEGEGRIAERVDLLWKLLLNWMEEIRKADFILVACHSQGVPVSIMLVAKLISFGCVNASRVGVCAMAGVNMGPFSSYRSRWISGSAGELFDFELPFSKVSKEYETALKRALDFGVRISYIGSIDDQLVSLESSLFSTVAHPYIYRSVFVDGRVHAPSFLSHLVGFALKLRNLGIPDHGLIRELSSPLAGSLYTGEGHSRLYDDEAVYYMAIQFALETSSVPDAKLSIKRSSPAVSPNPYILPFAMRGLLEEEYVRRELHEETMELLRQFDDWKPSSKVLKDVKFRLEGIRSKL
ncbi:uncharacterized protein N7496_006916 [Penicillium cataractarum]|uniref:YMC020W-like alpha/beta hydrolase domain-containing protein n=1 Tax=Penicillium cataractarum TaxID=2100454 RepID=A0A9W9V7V4_9EURO|nr:uncharacterized protein N7496_006916 [Penicillium cataractarum]KAJ5370824.1 hypothetical protein N7496_006916 [Penicillium cataractarum]